MNQMDYRVFWIHGIGNARMGYSNSWTAAFNEYLKFPLGDYIEVLWSPVFMAIMNPVSLDVPGIPLTPQEQLAESDLRNMMATTLLARASAVARAGGKPLVGEWSSFISESAVAQASDQAVFPDWLLKPEDTIGEFVRYLVSRRIRNAVKEKLKEQLRPLVGKIDDLSIIAHSWGTVVAYESLIDLEVELPAFKLTNLFTLGSPLWLVHQLLDDRSGRKPQNIGNWVNIHAQGDVIGSWLSPGFEVDKDFGVPNFDNTNDPHGSYFLKDNIEVQKDIVAYAILG
jgi:hypothetical protein